ncbi:MAG: DUF2203 domain-containing protein [Tepidisphaeraceae bacterium]
MAGPQFFTPQKRPAPSQPVRKFTVEQANRSIPLVKRIVSDIVAAHERATKQQLKLGKGKGGEQKGAQAELDSTVDRLQDLVDELSDIGCELKDYQTGLIDFVGRHEGRDVYLCWKLGEEKITHWHELDGGYAGRKPVSQLHEQD